MTFQKFARVRGTLIAVLLTGAISVYSVNTFSRNNDPFLFPEAIPAPADNQITSARVELGKSLFFDPRLSGSRWMSCASCHNPALGWSDGLPTALGNDMKKLARATPTIVNSAYGTIFMWDGRAPNLEAQATGPIQAAVEMNQNLDELLKRLAAIPGYVAMFERAYPSEGVTAKTLAKAIASFERTIVSKDSPFDRWRSGDENAVSESAKRGFALFTGKARCDACHQGFNFTDDGFHNIGLKTPDGLAADIGRFAHRKVAVLKGAFKTPTLRDIALTAPYMHNGIYATLEEVVDYYDRGGDIKENLDLNMSPLSLSNQEKIDLVNFMKSLTGKLVVITVPQLPR